MVDNPQSAGVTRFVVKRVGVVGLGHMGHAFAVNLVEDGYQVLAYDRGRVEMWRGFCRSDISVSAPFVWRCLSGSTVAPFPHPAHRTGRADFPHPALGQDLTPLFGVRRLLQFLNPLRSL